MLVQAFGYRPQLLESPWRNTGSRLAALCSEAEAGPGSSLPVCGCLGMLDPCSHLPKQRCAAEAADAAFISARPRQLTLLLLLRGRGS